MSSFGSAEDVWVRNLGNLRNTIRQEVIARQLGDHVDPGMSVLDVGCGQGTQGLRLAAHGCRVTGVDQSSELLGRFARDAAEARASVELIEGRFDQLDDLLGYRRFDLVCAHGLLMYLPDRAAAISALAGRSERPAGLLSITFRNGHALAMRPGLRHDWAAALDAFDSTTYVNELGVTARSDRLEGVSAEVEAAGLRVLDWYGVRVFNDAEAAGVEPPCGDDLRMLLDAEDLAGRRDPYRWMASQLHVIARSSDVA